MDKFLAKFGDPRVLREIISRRAGLSPTARYPKLGEGSWGAVYDIGKGRVLKLTADDTEANTMAIVESVPSELIVRVYDTFKLSPKAADKDLFGIVQEKLQAPTSPWVRFIGMIPDAVLRGKRALTAGLVERFLDELDQEREWDDYYLPEFTAEKLDWLTDLAEYFDSQRIRFYDFHGGNIMRRGRQHVLIDLGRSKSPRHAIDLAAHVADSPAARLIEELVEGRYSIRLGSDEVFTGDFVVATKDCESYDGEPIPKGTRLWYSGSGPMGRILSMGVVPRGGLRLYVEVLRSCFKKEIEK